MAGCLRGGMTRGTKKNLSRLLRLLPRGALGIENQYVTKLVYLQNRALFIGSRLRFKSSKRIANVNWGDGCHPCCALQWEDLGYHYWAILFTITRKGCFGAERPERLHCGRCDELLKEE